MHSEDCWDALGIKAIRDKKTIKKAYAKKLKVNRPDADPEGFKCLNLAYQECLSYIDYDWYWEDSVSINYDSVEPQQQTTQDTHLTDSNSLDNATTQSYGVSYANQTTYTASLDILPQHIAKDINQSSHEHEVDDSQTLLEDLKALVWDTDNRNDLSLWQSYLADDALLNFDFKNDVSLSLVQEILKLRQRQIAQIDNISYIPSSAVSASLLSYLDEFFGWQHSYQKLEQTFHHDDALFYFLDDLALAENMRLTETGQKNFTKQQKHKHPEHKPFYQNSWMVFFFIFIALQLAKQCQYDSRPDPITDVSMEQAIEDLRKQGIVFDNEGNLIFNEDALQQQTNDTHVSQPNTAQEITPTGNITDKTATNNQPNDSTNQSP